jgi:aflatoxin B1 aldehyde reductase
MSIQAYSPVAGGFLIKSRVDIEQGVGRWSSDSFFGQFYGSLYRKPSTLALLDDLEDLSAKSGVSKLGIAYRWVRYHSALDGSLGDLMLLGGRNAAHVKETLQELEKGPLEDWVVVKLDEMWKSVEVDAPVDNRDAVLKMMK